MAIIWLCVCVAARPNPANRLAQGDLFHLKGQISEAEVKSVMYQLLQVRRGWVAALYEWG
jgi:hypothetical protein